MKAFPSLYVHFNKTNEMAEPRLVANSHHGMDLRDYFAAAAIQGIMACCGTDIPYEERHTPEDLYMYEPDDEAAAWAYKIADSMMKAREQ